MSVTTSDDAARLWARRLEAGEARRTGVSIAAARKRVAGRLGIPVGTLENLSRDRMKGVRLWLFDTLQHAVIAELRREIQAHEHELAALMRDRGGRDGRPVAEVEAGLARLKALMGDGIPGDAG